MVNGDEGTYHINLSQEYYFKAGHLIHTLLQNWIGKVHDLMGDDDAEATLYGNWVCKQCKQEDIEEIRSHAACTQCGANMEYKEIGLKYGKYIVGHMDGLLRIDSGTDSSWWVIDFKTTSSKAMWFHQQNPVYPHLKYKHQIETYATLIQEQYGYNIDGWFLVYVTRDNIEQREVVGGTLSEARKQQLLLRARSNDQHFGLAINLDSKDKLDALQHRKPCKSMDWYSKYMFDGFNMCPLAANGVCFNNEQLAHTLDHAWAHRLIKQ